MNRQVTKRGYFILYIGVLICLWCSIPADYAYADEIQYGVGIWPDTLGLGNHRAVVSVAEDADAVWLHIPWRRRDLMPEKKDILIIDARDNTRIENVVRININREYGDIVFEPRTVPGNYFVYYMPSATVGSWWSPTTRYSPPSETTNDGWVERNGLSGESLARETWRKFAKAQVLEIQAINDFHRFDPMEVIATREEVNALLARNHGDEYFVFPEDRRYPIRMTSDVPYRWVETGPQKTFSGAALRNEYYVFQAGIFAARKPLANVSIRFENLKSENGGFIPDSCITCYNTNGVDWEGASFSKRVDIEPGKVQALWFGFRVPRDAVPGIYRGGFTILPANAPAEKISLEITVEKDILEDAGDSELWRHSRLRWLNSKIGIDDEVIAPFTPLVVKGMNIAFLGRSVTLSGLGLPERIQSTFSKTLESADATPMDILSDPIRFVVDAADGWHFKPVVWEKGTTRFVKESPGLAAWESESAGGAFEVRCRGTMECDGYMNISLYVRAREDVNAGDIRLEIPLKNEAAAYMMGMGKGEGKRAPEWQWRWTDGQRQAPLWLGSVNAGLRLNLKAEKSPGETVNQWNRDGGGGCIVKEQPDGNVLVTAFSGGHAFVRGEELHLSFDLLITPFKLPDRDRWDWRYYHNGNRASVDEWLPEAKKAGAKIINIHHANYLNPYINYPFREAGRLRNYIAEANREGIGVKIYYTVRELSCYTTELFALLSLGDEIFAKGPGFQPEIQLDESVPAKPKAGHSWLAEHVADGYEPAWHQPLGGGHWDAALRTVHLSRWHNYYLEGLGWLIENAGIRGLYLDGIGYDREVMKRLRKVMDRARSGCLLDFHSGHSYYPQYALNNPANDYMEHFPYLNSLWFGELFDYSSSPDYWLVEISGIPFGLSSEMLERGGNPWRGMIYGMTTRLPWSGNPAPLWKAWDDFGIREARMIGYWSGECPVKTDNKDILATVYLKPGKALISIASWGGEPAECSLVIDWKALGIPPDGAVLTAPAIEGFQKEAKFSTGGTIPVEPGKGWLLILEGR